LCGGSCLVFFALVAQTVHDSTPSMIIPYIFFCRKSKGFPQHF
jgi:hypothetical protein